MSLLATGLHSHSMATIGGSCCTHLGHCCHASFLDTNLLVPEAVSISMTSWSLLPFLQFWRITLVSVHFCIWVCVNLDWLKSICGEIQKYSLYEVKAGTFFPSSKNVYASIYSMKVTKSFFVTVDDMIESDPVAVNTHATKYCY